MTGPLVSSSKLIDKRFVDTSFGRIAIIEAGDRSRPTVLFVHGIPTSSYLWRHVLRLLHNDYHCIAPDLMGLGDTDVDPDKTNFDMENQAEMLLELMDVLGHDRFALVCHDQGGAAAQLIAARVPQRLTALAFTDCVCYDNWPVPAIARLRTLAQIPVLSALVTRTGIATWLETSTPLSNFRRGVHQRPRLTDETIREYLRPLTGTERAQQCFRKFLLAGNPRYTQMAVAGLRKLETPTLVVWAADDHFISPSWGRKLFDEIPGAERFELVPFCGHFWQEERPSEFASVIGEFLAKHLLDGVEVRSGELSQKGTVAEPPCKPTRPKSRKTPEQRT